MGEVRKTTTTKARSLWVALVLGVAVATLALAIPGVASAQATSASPQPQCPINCVALTYGCTNGAYSIAGSQICHDTSGWRWWTTGGPWSIVATPDSGHTWHDWSG